VFGTHPQNAASSDGWALDFQSLHKIAAIGTNKFPGTIRHGFTAASACPERTSFNSWVRRELQGQVPQPGFRCQPTLTQTRQLPGGIHLPTSPIGSVEKIESIPRPLCGLRVTFTPKELVGSDPCGALIGGYIIDEERRIAKDPEQRTKKQVDIIGPKWRRVSDPGQPRAL
jgi:hypothetical protein